MSFYMVQTMSCGPLTEVQYIGHNDGKQPSEQDLRRFTERARRNYAASRNVPLAHVVPGKIALRHRAVIAINAIELVD
ncbi:hypothetical protein [Trinickia diaoshuihuensis]|jgi:hypothetical protein|uniref:hypothetical protein n=1 Tax=Trinickia diaoshuihuensis TaxID=2292265 RepID=UPI000E288826|nr:hypothetical protein [Trinickia diaoshuihuensis]